MTIQLDRVALWRATGIDCGSDLGCRRSRRSGVSRHREDKMLALLLRGPDIHGMKRFLKYCAIALFALSVKGSVAQVIPPGGSSFLPPPPPPPPPPKIEVPAIPKMDELPQRSYAPTPQPSFGDRIGKCLDDAAAAGLGPNERATYSRNCASR